MKRKRQLTLDYLEKEVWWWREGAVKHPVDFKKDPVTLKPGPLFPIYKLAFNYELARRYDRSKNLVPFTDLGQAHLWIIGPDMGPPYLIQLASRQPGNEAQETEKGWTPVLPKRQWNLRESDRTLEKAFKAFIDNQRKVQGVAKPKGHARTRPISWRRLELMDLADFKVGDKMNESERSSLSKARKEAKRQHEVFEAVIDEYWNAHARAEWLENGDETDESPFDPLDLNAWLFPALPTPQPLYRHIWPTIV